jgi:hypothetical protein
MNILDQLHWTSGLVPEADRFAGGVTTVVVECRSAVGVLFIIFRGDSTGGTATGVVTVNACDDVAPTTTTAVPFWYRSSTTFDTWGAWTHVAATGFTMPTGDDQMHQVFVEASELAENGYGYAQMAISEPVNDPVDAAVLIAVIQQRYQQTTTTMLT